MRAGVRRLPAEGRRPGRDRAGPASGRCRRGAARTGDRRQRRGDAHRLMPPRQPDPFPSLTDREREVLELVAEGLDNRRDRPAPGVEREDGAQQPLDGVDQARRRRPRRSNRQSARRRPRITSRQYNIVVPGRRASIGARHDFEVPGPGLRSARFLGSRDTNSSVRWRVTQGAVGDHEGAEGGDCQHERCHR